MKTIEQAAMEYATDKIKCENSPLNSVKVIDNAKVQPFIDGAKWALENQWISTDEELPYQNHISKFDEHMTICVLCMNEDIGVWLDRMARKEDGNRSWLNYRQNATKWMIIPDIDF